MKKARPMLVLFPGIVVLLSLSCQDLISPPIASLPLPDGMPASSDGPQQSPAPTFAPSPTASPAPSSSPDPSPDFAFDFAIDTTEIRRSHVLYYHGAAQAQMVFTPTGQQTNFEWVDLMFWLKKPGQSRVLVLYNGSQVLPGPGNSEPGGSVTMDAYFTNLNKPLHQWPTWEQGYTELIVRATAAMSFNGSGDSQTVSQTASRERIISLVQNAPAMDGQMYKLDIELLADLSNDPGDYSYAGWRNWIEVNTDYPGGPPSYSTPKRTFGGSAGEPNNDSYHNISIFRPANLSYAESVKICIDKDGDDIADFEWLLVPAMLPISAGNNFRHAVCHFGVEGQIDPGPEVY